MAKKYGDWEVVEPLAEGGQAHVYKVKHTGSTEIEGSFALKRLKNSKRIARFEQEVKALKDLNHPNVVRIYDADLEHDPAYYVMALYEGGSLENFRAANVNLTPLEKLNIFAQICHGVRAAHRLGVFHRDIKPANIFHDSSDHSFKVGDFGLVYVENEERLTLTEEQVGSRNYMAPELEHGDEPTAASDIYSLGKTLYFLFVGSHLPGHSLKTKDYAAKVVGDNDRLVVVKVLISQMIREEPSRRLQSVEVVQRFLGEITTVLTGNYNVPIGDVVQRCIYCGLGTYVLVGTTSEVISNATVMKMYDGKHPALLRCNRCGNAQFFFTSGLTLENWPLKNLEE